MKLKSLIALATLLVCGQGAWADGTKSFPETENEKGTEEKPFLIESIADLNALASDVNSGTDYQGTYFRLTTDLDYSEETATDGSNFTPIGIVEMGGGDTPIYDKCFKGVFDGNGKTIRGITVYKQSGEAIAIFGNVGYPGIIKNVKLANSSFTGNFCVGGIVGEYPTAGNDNDEHGIYNCEVGSDVTVKAVTFTDDGEEYKGWCVGGIVGDARVTTVSGCVSAATVSGDEYVGGIVGQIYKDTDRSFGTLSDCYYTGSSVSGSNDAKYVGKIIGLNGKDDESYEYVSGSSIVPAITLLNNDTEATINNATRLSNYNGIGNVNVTLSGRTLYKDGAWNTIVLPFGLTLEGSPLAGAIAQPLNEASISGTTLYLTFGDAVTELEAGTPYIIKWESGDNIVSPVFNGVIIDETTHDYDNNASDDALCVRFLGTYKRTTFDAEDKSILFMGGGNTLYYPQNGVSIGALRAYFKIGDGSSPIKQFVLNFGEDEATGIGSLTPDPSPKGEGSIYSLDGRRFHDKPAQKGVYIVNGRKVIIK